MLMVNQLNGFGVGGGGSVKVLTYQTQAVSTSGLTTYTFSGQAIGTASTDRYVIVATGGGFGGGRSVISVTIGGVTATVTAQSATDSASAIAYALVPTGTTADVVVEWSGSESQCGIGVWSATGLESPTPVATGTSTASPGSVTLSTAAGGFAIAYRHSGGSPSSYTWTNATENFDADIGVEQHTGASVATVGGNLTIEVAYDGGGDANRSMSAAAW